MDTHNFFQYFWQFTAMLAIGIGLISVGYLLITRRRAKMMEKQDLPEEEFNEIRFDSLIDKDSGECRFVNFHHRYGNNLNLTRNPDGRLQLTIIDKVTGKSHDILLSLNDLYILSTCLMDGYAKFNKTISGRIRIRTSIFHKK